MGTSTDSSIDRVAKRKSRGVTFAKGSLQLKADEE
jgi:hypothetical protein